MALANSLLGPSTERMRNSLLDSAAAFSFDFKTSAGRTVRSSNFVNTLLSPIHVDFDVGQSQAFACVSSEEVCSRHEFTGTGVLPSTSRMEAGAEETKTLTTAAVLTAEMTPLSPSPIPTFSFPTTKLDGDLVDTAAPAEVVPCLMQSELGSGGDATIVSAAQSISLDTSYVKPAVMADENTVAIVDEQVEDVGALERAKERNQSKLDLLNQLCSALIGSPDFKNKSDEKVATLVQLLSHVAATDPEFIVKSALYGRCILNLRTPANFLLAYAAMTPSCRPFLKKYFGACVRLPTDWMEVPELLATMGQAKRSGRFVIPRALRNAMVEKFESFDEYQLAKHNKGKKTNKKKKGDEKGKGGSSGGGRGGRGAGRGGKGRQGGPRAKPPQLYNLKKLIKQLHVDKPANLVLGILGKRYPTDAITFARSGLLGVWDEERGGKRMKLATPETWETQISMRGNRADVWTGLIENKKLPYMALLRNLRNIIKSGVKPHIQADIIRRLQNERQVINSKQFPFRFFSAYEVLDNLIKDRRIQQDMVKALQSSPAIKINKKNKDVMLKLMIKRRKELQQAKQFVQAFDEEDVKKYKAALDNAVKIATLHNVRRIPGRTLVFVDVTEDAQDTPCTSARGLGPPKNAAQIGTLMGLMAKYACEDCVLYGLLNSDAPFEIPVQKGTILANMDTVLGDLPDTGRAPLTKEEMEKLICSAVDQHCMQRIKMDNLLVLSSTSVFAESLAASLARYRQVVNDQLLFVNVELTGSARTTSSRQFGTHNDKNVFLTGYSDQILRYVGERGSDAQLLQVEAIDAAFRLEDISPPTDIASLQQHLRQDSVVSMETSSVTRRKEIRVFVSSTFKDMHSERDVITRFVYPELRKRSQDCFSRESVLIDLRWGITAEQHGNRGVEICLEQAKNADLFIGLIGTRYGYVPDGVPAAEQYGRGLSVTELECRAFKEAHRADFGNRMVVYVRDEEFLENVPLESIDDFVCEEEEEMEKLAKFKNTLSSWNVARPYSCHYAGRKEGFARTGNLSTLAQGVLDLAWDMATAHVSSEPADATDRQVSTFLEREKKVWSSIRHSAEETVGYTRTTTAVVSLAKKAKDGLTVYVTANVGEGKTMFASKLSTILLRALKNNVILCCSKEVLVDTPVMLWLWNALKYYSEPTPEMLFAKPQDGNILKEVSETLTELAKQTKVVIVFDGYAHDELTGVADVARKNVCIIVTCDAAPTQPVSGHHHSLALEELMMSERHELVTRRLSTYGKALDTNAFNNQLRLLLTKRGASSPLFLSLATDLLLSYGSFENLSGLIRSIPSTVQGVVQMHLLSLEKDHGKEVVGAVAGVIAAAVSGVTYDIWYKASDTAVKVSRSAKGLRADVYALARGATKSDPVLPRGLFMLVANAMNCLLRRRTESNGEELISVRSELIGTMLLKAFKDTASYKASLAATVLAECDPNDAGLFLGCSDTAFCSLLDSLEAVKAWRDVGRCLTSVSCLSALFTRGCGDGLVTSFINCRENLSEPAEKTKKRKVEEGDDVECLMETLNVYQEFVVRNKDFLMRYPQLIVQSAANEPSDSVIAKDPSIPFVRGRCSVPILLEQNSQRDGIPCQRTTASNQVYSTATALSLDGHLIAVGYLDGSIALSEAASLKTMGVLRGHTGKVNGLAFLEGSGLLCSVSDDKSVILWNVVSRNRYATLSSNHVNVVSSCTVMSSLPRGTGLVTGGWDGFLIQWDYRKKRDVQFISTGSPINSIASHESTTRVACGHWDGAVRIYDLLDGKRKAVLHGDVAVRSVRYSPCGKFVAAALMDGHIKMFSADFGHEVGRLDTQSRLPVQSLSFTDDSLYSASHDGSLRVWSSSLGEPQLSINVEDVTCVSCKWGTSYLGFGDGRVMALDIKGQISWEQKCMSNGILYLSAVDSKSVLVAGRTEAAVWSSTGRLQAKLSTDGTPIKSVATSESYLALCHSNGLVSTYKTVTGYSKTEAKPTAVFYAHDGGTAAASFSEVLLATVGADKHLKIWHMEDVVQENPVPEVAQMVEGTDSLNAVAWCDYKGMLATGGSDGSVIIWQYKIEGLSKLHTVADLGGAILKLSAMYACIAVHTSSGGVHVLTTRGVMLTTLHTSASEVSLTYAEPSGSWAMDVEQDATGKRLGVDRLQDLLLATANAEGATVWKPLVANCRSVLPGHRGVVTSLSSATGVLVSSGADGACKLWKVDSSGQGEKRRGDSHSGAVTCVKVTSDFVITGGCDGEVHLWDTATGRLVSTAGTGMTSPASALDCLKSYIFVGYEDGSLLLLELQGKTIRPRESLRLSEDSPVVAVMTEMGQLVTMVLSNQTRFTATVVSIEEGGLSSFRGLSSGGLYYTPGLLAQCVKANGLLTPHRANSMLQAFLRASPSDSDGSRKTGIKRLLTLAESESVCEAVTDGHTTFIAETSGWVNAFSDSTAGMEELHRFRACDGKLTGLCLKKSLLHVVSDDACLRVWDVAEPASAKLVGVWESQAPLCCVDTSGVTIACGDSLGRVHTLLYRGYTNED